MKSKQPQEYLNVNPMENSTQKVSKRLSQPTTTNY